MRRALPIALLAALPLACGGGDEPAPRPAQKAQRFAAVQESAPQRPAGRYLTARMTRRALLRATPGGRRLARLGTRTEFGSPRVLSVVRRRGAWLQVLAPELRNGRRGWIPAGAASLGGTDFSLHVDRSAHRLELRHSGAAVHRMTVAVGRPANPTPLGRFAVTDKLRPSAADSPYGCCIVALTGHQTKLVAGWPGGDRLAVHNTPQPETVGKAVSLGCMRGHRGDMRLLMRRVPLGAPVFIRA